MQAAFASGDAPDIFQMPLGTNVSSMVDDELIQPISGLVSEKWSEQYYESTFQEGVNKIDGEIIRNINIKIIKKQKLVGKMYG